ncbi:MAG: serpin family protein [Bacteroidota bacterium]
MKRSFCWFIFLIPMMLNAGTPDKTAEGNNRFAFGLFHELTGNPGQTILFSPFSISTALAMTYGGARDETARQMSVAMNFSRGEDFHSSFRKMISRINEGTEGNVRLDMANGLWAQRDFSFLPSYFDQVKSDYHAELRNVDFTDPAERKKCMAEINGWVEHATNNRIRDLLSPGDLNPFTRLVLVNAIYFLGDWDEPFAKESTSPKDFFPEAGTRVRVPFMNRHGRYGYCEDAGIRVIEIPYRGNSASMVIFLPDSVNGTAGFEQSFDFDRYLALTALLQPAEVRLSLPKFRATSKTRLKDTLSKMGMPIAFSTDLADFSGMTGKPNLCISEVIHQAFIEADEKGTEAAAATAVVMRTMAARPSPDMKVFNAYHPFIFCIKDNATGTILFMGKIMDPSVAK